MFMSNEPTKNPFDEYLNAVRMVIRTEIRTEMRNKLPDERLLDAAEAAALLCVSEDWLYHNIKDFPFVRRLSPKIVRFSYRGILQWIEAKQ
jgi:predicted DNA-binding transcriptional regulator AlpA